MDLITFLVVVIAVSVVSASAGGLIGYALAVRNARVEQENYRN